MITGTVDEDISITLNSPVEGSEEDSAVKVETVNGTAYLVLRRPLDRERVVGPGSLTTSVLCERLASGDPGFVIPVSVR